MQQAEKTKADSVADLTVTISVHQMLPLQYLSLIHIFHSCTIKSGTLEVGTELRAIVDFDRRANIMRNHTAAHLLQDGSSYRMWM